MVGEYTLLPRGDDVCDEFFGRSLLKSSSFGTLLAESVDLAFILFQMHL